ncbi:hypothetical protein RSO01_69890 [Reyranella soli]|uniref:Uncharacterized protein n=1 Tax=Reyranella soli TaxID=1230389 RepID=A0A512NLK1_9HYPH|nr:hypothetical protein RSO01_69890 [Reyranella soli]
MESALARGLAPASYTTTWDTTGTHYRSSFTRGRHPSYTMGVRSLILAARAGLIAQDRGADLARSGAGARPALHIDIVTTPVARPAKPTRTSGIVLPDGARCPLPAPFARQLGELAGPG